VTNYFFRNEPNPDARDPQDVRILALRAEPYPDGLRYKIFVDLTPFKQPPNLEVQLRTDGQEEPLARVNIIEAVNENLTFVMHLRVLFTGALNLYASLDYQDAGRVHQLTSPVGEEND